MVDVHEWIGVLLSHDLKFILERDVAVTCDQTNVSECANSFGSALATTFFVSLQEIAELVIVLSLLLLNGHDVLERLSELLQMNV